MAALGKVIELGLVREDFEIALLRAGAPRCWSSSSPWSLFSSSSAQTQLDAGISDASQTLIGRPGALALTSMTGKVTSEEDDESGKSVGSCGLGGGTTSSMLGLEFLEVGRVKSRAGAGLWSAQAVLGAVSGGLAGSGGAVSSGKSASRAQGTVDPAGRTRSSSRSSARAKAERMRLIEPALQLQAIGVEDIPTGHGIRSMRSGFEHSSEGQSPW